MLLRIVLLATVVLGAWAATVGAAEPQDDIREHRSCLECGMDRKAYGYSRMLILYQDGSQTGVCSLHCAAVELDAHKDRAVKSILVADRETRLLVDAEKAFWVLGGKKRGVMTQLPKWAFAAEPAARSFIADNGGSLVSWAEALAAARKETGHSR